MKTFLPSYSKVNCWMKCGGMISPLASLTKPESIGCWISTWTSVVSPLEIARTRMVDAIGMLLVNAAASAAATADSYLDFLGGAIKFAAGFHDHDHVAGFRHFEAIGHARHRTRRNLVNRRQRVRIFGGQKCDRCHIRESRAGGYRNHSAVFRDFRRIELDLVRGFSGPAIERFDRVGCALLLERIFRIFVVDRSEGRSHAKRNKAESGERDRARTFEDQAPRGRKAVVSGRHLKSPAARAAIIMPLSS